ncbi:hypothetical protein [Anaerotruncus rubiinfantis]|uniref:hypothetical protein n=1 Tax=Anaerotruncus rubiinfantis TaxID=1720200 RepID=UPI00082C0675|nr:hypothetical protein [Anaerotruncus rubiinfantis]
MTYDEILARYISKFLTDKQLDGTGAVEGDPEFTENCVAVQWITQEQANAIRAGAVDPETADMLAAINIYEGGE